MSVRHAFESTPTKILLPIDFSPSSQAALETAADLASHFHAELFLVNVLPIFSTFTPEYAVPQVQFPHEENPKLKTSRSLTCRHCLSNTFTNSMSS